MNTSNSTEDLNSDRIIDILRKNISENEMTLTTKALSLRLLIPATEEDLLVAGDSNQDLANTVYLAYVPSGKSYSLPDSICFVVRSLEEALLTMRYILSHPDIYIQQTNHDDETCVERYSETDRLEDHFD